MNTLPVGKKFKKNQILAATKNFNLETGTYTSGKNVTIAVMNYLGFSHEDAYCVSNSLCNSTTTDTIKEVYVIVPPETKVLQLEKELGKKTQAGETLVEFIYEENLQNYMLAHEFDVDSDDLETILGSGNNSIFLRSPGGEIVD